MINLDNLNHYVFHVGGEKPATIAPRPTTAWENFHNLTAGNPEYQLAPLSIWKDALGLVRYAGVITDGVFGATDASAIVYLPANYSVIRKYIHQSVVHNGVSPNTHGRVDIRPDTGDNGAIMMQSAQGGAGPWAAISGYFPTNLRGWKSLASLYQNSTVDFESQNVANSSIHQGGMYWKDPFGFVHIKGMIKTFPNSNTFATPAFTMPAGYRPAASEIFPTIGSDTYGQIRIDTLGRVYMYNAAGTNAYQTINMCYMEADAALNDDWTDMTLLNSWVPHAGGFQTPQWIVTPDGMLHLRGLMKSGTTAANTDIWTIPTNIALSSFGQIYPISTGGDRAGAMDLRPDLGVLRLRTIGTSGTNAYCTLSNIEYRVDWATNF